jgi:cytochrome c-type biogenesis protein CcmH
LLALPLVVFAQDSRPPDPQQQRVTRLAEQLRCLVCQNQSIADSNAELAVDLRRQINEQITQGRSDAEIVDFMVQRYGDFVLYKPPMKATTLVLWFGPVALLLLGGGVLLHNLRQRRKLADASPLSDEERRAAARLLDRSSAGDGR